MTIEKIFSTLVVLAFTLLCATLAHMTYASGNVFDGTLLTIGAALMAVAGGVLLFKE